MIDLHGFSDLHLPRTLTATGDIASSSHWEAFHQSMSIAVMVRPEFKTLLTGTVFSRMKPFFSKTRLLPTLSRTFPREFGAHPYEAWPNHG